MGDLPPEIWYAIINYIPPASLRRLYGLNRVFFEVVMQDKYRSVVLDSRERGFQCKVDGLRIPSIARHVKSLHLAAHVHLEEVATPVRQPDSSAAVKLVDKVMKQVKKIRKTRSSPQLREVGFLVPTWCSEFLFRRLINIEDLHINYAFLEHVPGGSVDNLWRATASKLKTIHITASTMALQNILPPLDRVRFSKLTSLIIRINDKAGSGPDELISNNVQQYLAAFANSVKSTLQYLSVLATPSHHLPLFYTNLERFDHLITFDGDLTLPSFMLLKYPIILPSAEFVVQHQDVIQHFTLTTSRMAVFRTPEMEQWEATYEFMIPNLRFFSFGSNILTARSQRVLRFLKRHASTLESLELVGPISPQELDELLAALVRRPRRAVLSKLSISIYRLDLSVMLKLMKALPALKTLKLRTMRIAKGTLSAFVPGQHFPLCLPPHAGVHEFVSEFMSCDELKGWGLRDIVIERHSCCGDLTLWNLMRLMALCIPSVSSFAEAGHMNIPDSPNPSPQCRTTRCPGGSFRCLYGKDGVDASPL